MAKSRSEKEKRFDLNSQGIEPLKANDEDVKETLPKRALADAVDDVCNAMTIADAPSVSSSTGLDDFEMLVAAEDEKEDEFEFV